MLGAYYAGANKVMVILSWANKEDVEHDVPNEARARMQLCVCGDSTRAARCGVWCCCPGVRTRIIRLPRDGLPPSICSHVRLSAPHLGRRMYEHANMLHSESLKSHGHIKGKLLFSPSAHCSCALALSILPMSSATTFHMWDHLREVRKVLFNHRV